MCPGIKCPTRCSSVPSGSQGEICLKILMAVEWPCTQARGGAEQMSGVQGLGGETCLRLLMAVEWPWTCRPRGGGSRFQGGEPLRWCRRRVQGAERGRVLAQRVQAQKMQAQRVLMQRALAQKVQTHVVLTQGRRRRGCRRRGAGA